MIVLVFLIYVQWLWIMKDSERVLKVCPFCGGYARFVEDERFSMKPETFSKWHVMCMKCRVRTPQSANIPTAMKIWNERI